ncbi:uncharacterized protein [Halyomorpha halys]|uniref:uncharacterized protein isoform X2 n=1 Tax=Halyomorpha halys TaxID=286706 RepID=UPI0006D52241
MGACTVFLKLIFISIYVSGIMGLKHVRVHVPMAVKEGETALLLCFFDLEGDSLYSVKWYKGGREIFRYIPRETPSIKIFPIPGLEELHIEKSRSNATHLYLKKVTKALKGRYSCEVSADAPSFRTALYSGDMNVVVIPTTLPEVLMSKIKYRIGETLKAECTSKDSRPAANLTWGLNGQTLDSENVKKFNIIRDPDTNLETSVSQLSMIVQSHHFSSNGRLKVRCTASIHNVYWRTTERSAEEDRPKVLDAAQVRKPTEFFYTTPVPSRSSQTVFRWSSFGKIEPLILLINLLTFLCSSMFV